MPQRNPAPLRTRLAAALFTLVLTTNFPHEILAEPSADPHSAFVKSWSKRVFAGWRSLVFRCDLSPADQMNNALCDWAAAKVRISSKPLNIKVLNLGNLKGAEAGWQEAQSKLEFPLTLNMAVHSTGHDPRGVHVRLSAEKYYSDAVASDTFYLKAEDPLRLARPGHLVFWELSFIAAGPPGGDLDAAVRNALETNLMRFLSDFVEARE